MPKRRIDPGSFIVPMPAARHSFAPIALVVAFTLAAAAGVPVWGCADGSSGFPGRGTPLGVPEEPIDCIPLTGECFAPFPTNLLTRAASSSPTGIQINFRDENFSTPVAAQVLDVYPVDLLNRATGFSPASPIVLPLPAIPDPASLPADPASSVEPAASIRLVDLETLEPVPFRAYVDPVGLAADPPAPILFLIPGQALRNRATYLAVATDRIRTEQGSPMPAFPGYAALQGPGPLASPDAESARRAYEPVFSRMRDDLDEDPARTVLSTVFTIRSDEEITRSMRMIRKAVDLRARTNPSRWVPIQTNPVLPIIEDGVELGLVGGYTTPDFRGPDGKIVYDSSGLPVEQKEHWLEFVLKLPAGATRPAPVVVFGHGLGAFKESLVQVTGDLGSRGYAVIGIDVAGHNSRVAEDGFIGSYFRFDRIEETRDLLLQTIADEMQLVQLVRGALSTLDIVPDGGDGIPDLAPGPFGYVGQSLGAVPGVVFTACEPEIVAAVMNVGGAGFVDMLLLSEGLGGILDSFVPPGARPIERLALAAMAQMLVDPVEPLNFAQHVSERRFSGHPARDVLLQESIGDPILPNAASEALARSMGLPLVEPFLEEIFGLEHVAAPALGSGVYQFFLGPVEWARHGLLLITEKAGSQVGHFIDSRIRTGQAEIIEP